MSSNNKLQKDTLVLSIEKPNLFGNQIILYNFKSSSEILKFNLSFNIFDIPTPIYSNGQPWLNVYSRKFQTDNSKI